MPTLFHYYQLDSRENSNPPENKNPTSTDRTRDQPTQQPPQPKINPTN